jgi:hypothetical protein
MGLGWSEFRRSPAGLLAAGLLVLAAETVTLVAAGVPGRQLLVLLPVLICYGPILLLLAADLDRDSGRPSAEVLDRLVVLKQRGALVPGDRPRLTRRDRPVITPRRPRGPSPAGGALDRLVAIKRSLGPCEEDRRRQVEREPWSEP